MKASNSRLVINTLLSLISSIFYYANFAYAAVTNPGNTSNPGDTLLKGIVTNIVNPVIYLLVFLAVVYFVYGVMVFIKNADNSEKRKEGSQHMLWGVIGIFIMFSAKGIIYIILTTLGLK
jgi:hypothetical protein